jgi:Raf kinase inhibitor-like YbhB/YbcL family protein
MNFPHRIEFNIISCRYQHDKVSGLESSLLFGIRRLIIIADCLNGSVFRVSTMMAILSFALAINGCEKQNSVDSVDSGFILSSSAIASDSLLPVEYTCDGESASPPLEWSGFPEGTKYFALIMHHEASPTDIHSYWVLYNIPSAVVNLPKNVTDVGALGSNSVNDRTEYAPPCSQGPGRKNYFLTVYALSEKAMIDLPPENVDREVLLNAIKNITLSSARMVVWYSREIK